MHVFFVCLLWYENRSPFIQQQLIWLLMNTAQKSSQLKKTLRVYLPIYLPAPTIFCCIHANMHAHPIIHSCVYLITRWIFCEISCSVLIISSYVEQKRTRKRQIWKKEYITNNFSILFIIQYVFFLFCTQKKKKPTHKIQRTSDNFVRLIFWLCMFFFYHQPHSSIVNLWCSMEYYHHNNTNKLQLLCSTLLERQKKSETFFALMCYIEKLI